jgi:ATP/ADP translocase
MFFLVLWLHSRARPALMSFLWFAAVAAVITIIDVMRYGGLGDEQQLYAIVGWFLPVLYLAAMVLLPLFTRLGAEKPVPERVTA